MKRKLLFSLITSIMITSLNVKGSNPVDSRDLYENRISGSGERQYVVDTDNSFIYWKGSKPGGSHNGILTLKEGLIKMKDGEILSGSFVIDMNSIVCLDLESKEWNDKLVNHLKSEDFFNVQENPTAAFVLTKAELLQSEGNEDYGIYKLFGNLTIKGITKSISFNTKLMAGENRLNAAADQFGLDRTEWNINYQSKSVFSQLKDSFINDEMLISIKLVAVGE